MRNRLTAGAATGTWGRMQLELLAGVANHAVVGIVTCKLVNGEREPENIRHKQLECATSQAGTPRVAVDSAFDDNVGTVAA